MHRTAWASLGGGTVKKAIWIGLWTIWSFSSHQALAIDFPSVIEAAARFHNADSHLELMYKNALLDTPRQSYLAPDGTAYVKTGDIPAEWFRDASAQVRPYIYFAKADPLVAKFLRGMIERIGKNLQSDAYANAYKLDYTIWEEKFELDSLAYPIMLAWTYWQYTGDRTIFTENLSLGFDQALDVMEAEQDHAAHSNYTHPEIPKGGKGNPVAVTGMIWTGFRPSDDACKYNFLIPSEMMAVVALGNLEQIEHEVFKNDAKAKRAHQLRVAVNRGIQKYGVIDHPKYGKIYAYEVDGLGNSNLMDDANLPSLLSTPYFGYMPASDPTYQRTRKFILSPDNRYYYRGIYAEGEGSPHTPSGFIWPLALLAQGFTATSPAEKSLVLKELLASDPGDGLLHESFYPDNPKRFTRRDFGWPNSLFAEYVMTTLGGVKPLPQGVGAGYSLKSRH